jgi:hypothetical protein
MLSDMMIVYCNVPPLKFEAEMLLPSSRSSFPVIIGIAVRFPHSLRLHLEPFWPSVGEDVRQPVASLLTENPNYSGRKALSQTCIIY